MKMFNFAKVSAMWIVFFFFIVPGIVGTVLAANVDMAKVNAEDINLFASELESANMAAVNQDKTSALQSVCASTGLAELVNVNATLMNSNVNLQKDIRNVARNTVDYNVIMNQANENSLCNEAAGNNAVFKNSAVITANAAFNQPKINIVYEIAGNTGPEKQAIGNVYADNYFSNIMINSPACGALIEVLNEKNLIQNSKDHKVVNTAENAMKANDSFVGDRKFQVIKQPLFNVDNIWVLVNTVEVYQNNVGVTVSKMPNSAAEYSWVLADNHTMGSHMVLAA